MIRRALTALAFAGAVAGAIVTLAAPAAAAPGVKPQVSFDVKHDRSLPLTAMAATLGEPPATKVRREIPVKLPPNLMDRLKRAAGAPDPLRQVQQFPTTSATPTPAPLFNFPGNNEAHNVKALGFRVVPPDTEGDVGPNHYVQATNLVMTVYAKNGENIFGPVPMSALWVGFGGICETNDDGDPIVLYDHLADRWMVSQFGIDFAGNMGHQCIAVSTSGDPTGSWFRYDFLVSPAGFNDYPKFGLWPDGYYMSANEFDLSTGFFTGAMAVAFERSKMLTGSAAQMVKFGGLECDTAACFFSLQPSHLEGGAPPAGTPNTFIMSFDDAVWGDLFVSGPDGYQPWDFTVDWVTPASSTFTQLSLVTTSDFDAVLCFFGPCVPQLRGEKLDALAQFTMYRAQFRHHPAPPPVGPQTNTTTVLPYDSIVINHTVDADGDDHAGIRWAELRNDGSGWSLYQTGTYAPSDRLQRWMGSIAMDREGNIALGYSASGKKARPSVRYVTRTAADTPGTMPGGEVVLYAGAGSQRSSFNRWGDYSTMSVDPADDCTFWYTQEYYDRTSSFNFKTRIGAFKLPGCGSSCVVTESPEVSCSDGIDNDCDGVIDVADTDCTSCSVTESPEVSCSDGIDNDCDGFIDSLDPDCAVCDLGKFGDPCTKNADCCSGICRGKRTKKCKGPRP